MQAVTFDVIIALIPTAASVIAILAAVSGMRKQAEKSMIERVRGETEMAADIREIRNMLASESEARSKNEDRIATLDSKLNTMLCEIAKVEYASSSAHKRIDEHLHTHETEGRV